MSLKSQMTSDLDMFFNTDEFASTITYTPTGGDPVSITAVPGAQDATGQDPVPSGDTMVIFVMAAEVENPQYKDQFTIDGETWYFRRNLSGGANDGVYELEISRSEWRPI